MNARQVSSVQLARVDVVGSIVRGSRLVEAGSRDPYVTGTWSIEGLVTTLVTRRLGIDFAFGCGETALSQNDVFGRVEAAAITPLALRDGARGHSFVVGVGLGASFGDRYWWGNLRGYPYALARASYLFSHRIWLSGQWSIAPVDTSLASGLWTVENRFDVAAGIGLFSAGIRVGVTTIRGGDPERTYGDVEVSFVLGIGARFQTKKGRR